MIVSVCLLLSLSIGYATSLSRTDLTISECAAKGGECDETKGRPVCGTDNQTYPSRCHLIRAQCSGHQVSFRHRGPCKECLESRQYALDHRTSSPNKFVPKCRADGTYALIQCMDDSGCWCSDRQGKPIPNTTTRGGKPTCLKIAKSNTRRSPMRTVNRNKRGCNRTDQAMFNVNLLKEFHSDHGRHKHDGRSNVTDKMIVEWKFSLLDTNHNNLLDKNEFKEFKKIVRKVVKPKRCGRAFGKFCDADRDERLNLEEWSNCLSKDGLNHELNGPSDHLERTKLHNVNHGTDEYEDSNDYDDEPEDYNYSSIGLNNNNGDVENRFDEIKQRLNKIRSNQKYPPVLLLRAKQLTEGEPHVQNTENESDCVADRKAALDEQMNGASAIYVPECTPDGRYQRVQCYLSVGYCWCVNEDTGKNIPGTSVKDQRPNCTTNISRPMKGCSEPKKREFLKELKDFLKNHISKSANAGSTTTKWASEDERIATLSFVLLDENKNRVWERREWKTFRNLVISARQLKKCGKKMPRYCDVNNDKKITLSEWLNCLQIQDTVSSASNKNLTSNTQITGKIILKGPNPLESILKSD